MNQPIGLYNGGATCWLNSIYQALTALDPIMCIIRARTRDTSECVRTGTYIILHTMSARMFRTRVKSDATLARCTFVSHPFSNWQLIIDATNDRTTPSQYYDGSFARDARIGNAREFLAACPVVHIALALADQDQYAGVYLFCAMVLHCALVGARPLPEYGSIGEVSPSVIDLIISALDAEACQDQHVRDLFEFRSQSITLCAQHIETFDAHGADSRAIDVSRCISIVPTSDAREFVAQVHASIDMSERVCHLCARESRACANITTRARLPCILTIMTDDQTARSLTSSTSTQVYRRSPIGTISVPEAFDVEDAVTREIVTYVLVAQIIQEGGHFATIIRRASEDGQSCAWYASDMSVTEHDACAYSPGTVVLFYVSRAAREVSLCAPIDLRTIARAYVELHDSRQVVSACGQSWQRLAPHVVLDRAQYDALDSATIGALYGSMSSTQKMIARDNSPINHRRHSAAGAQQCMLAHAGVIYPTRVARMAHLAHIRI